MNLKESLAMKPVKRSALRLWAGKRYYRLKRYKEWVFTSKQYATSKSKTLFPYRTAHHQTVMLRKLKDVEMWYQHNKITNLNIAVNQLDGLVVNPGETFSYWKLLGKPSKAKGYVDGMVLYYGSFKTGTGRRFANKSVRLQIK